jgi:hypothetical protein
MGMGVDQRMGFPLRVRREAQLKNPMPQEEAMAERRTWRQFTAAFEAQAVKRLIEGSRGLAR